MKINSKGSFVLLEINGQKVVVGAPAIKPVRIVSSDPDALPDELMLEDGSKIPLVFFSGSHAFDNVLKANQPPASIPVPIPAPIAPAVIEKPPVVIKELPDNFKKNISAITELLSIKHKTADDGLDNILDDVNLTVVNNELKDVLKSVELLNDKVAVMAADLEERKRRIASGVRTLRKEFSSVADAQDKAFKELKKIENENA